MDEIQSIIFMSDITKNTRCPGYYDAYLHKRCKTCVIRIHVCIYNIIRFTIFTCLSQNGFMLRVRKLVHMCAMPCVVVQ